jgi:hypothetical protein
VQHTVKQIYGEGFALLLSVSFRSRSAAFSDVLADFVAEVGNLVGGDGSCLFTAGRCHQQADSHLNTHTDSQSNSFAEYLRIFLAAKRIGGAAAVGERLCHMCPALFL